MAIQRFNTTIARSGSRFFIPIPFDPNQAWGVKRRHYVRGTINNCIVRGSLGSDGSQFFLPLGAVWRRDCGVDAGAVVKVVLDAEGPQVDALSTDINAALELEPQAMQFFAGLATFYRNNYVRWIEGAKRPETRAARIAEMIELLKAGKKQR